MIKKLRYSKNLTQNEVAKKLDITQSYLSKLENKKVEITHIPINLSLKISKLFDICPFILFGHIIKHYPLCHFKCINCSKKTFKM